MQQLNEYSGTDSLKFLDHMALSMLSTVAQAYYYLI